MLVPARGGRVTEPPTVPPGRVGKVSHPIFATFPSRQPFFKGKHPALLKMPAK